MASPEWTQSTPNDSARSAKCRSPSWERCSHCEFRNQRTILCAYPLPRSGPLHPATLMVGSEPVLPPGMKCTPKWAVRRLSARHKHRPSSISCTNPSVPYPEISSYWESGPQSVLGVRLSCLDLSNTLRTNPTRAQEKQYPCHESNVEEFARR